MKTEKEHIVEETPAFVEPGTLLKEKREALGLTQQQVADRLRLRVTIIQNLEENKFESDLVATFIRGYLRSYAKAVGLKESEILAAYEKSAGKVSQEQTMQSFSRKTKRAKHDSHLNIITWGVLVILIGMSSLWWWQNHRDTGVVVGQDDEVSAVLDNDAATKESDGKGFATVSELTEEQGEEPVEVTEPATDGDVAADEAMASEDASVQSADTNEATASDSQDVAAEQTTAVAEESAPVVANDDSTLTMSFTADCWVQVKDATGKTLVTGIKKAGQSVDLRGKKPLQVILGAPEGVTMTFASEPVDLSRYTSGKVARFTLP